MRTTGKIAAGLAATLLMVGVANVLMVEAGSDEKQPGGPFDDLNVSRGRSGIPR